MAAAVLAAVTVPGIADAQTAPPDPAQAVRSRLQHQTGVTVAEVARFSLAKGGFRRIRVQSEVQLGPDGPVGSYMKIYDVPDPNTPWTLEADRRASLNAVDRYNAIYADGRMHLLDEGLYASLPDGKTWYRTPADSGDKPAFTVQRIDVYNPLVLASLVAGKKATAVQGGWLYQGTTSYKALSKAAGDRVLDTDPKPIRWWLWTDATGLPARLRTAESAGDFRHSGSANVDTRFSDWGRALVVTAPPADQVADERLPVK